MTKDQVVATLTDYRNLLVNEGFYPKKLDSKTVFPRSTLICDHTKEQVLSHSAWMCEEILYALDNCGHHPTILEEALGKAFRWLGFIQATLWLYGIYSIDEMRDHNRR